MIHYQRDTDHIVTLSLDMSGRDRNVINHEVGRAFVPVIRHLQQEKARGMLRGIILTSAKKTFLAGGDLEYLYRTTDARELFDAAQMLKAFLRDLEQPGVPVVAALNGDAIGTGFEVALACHHRIALADYNLRLGQPEVNIGLIPSGGAIIRLMWLLGIEKAAPILLQGRRYSPQEAYQVGIIDDLATDRKDLLQRAKTWILANRGQRRPWDDPDKSIPGGSVREAAVADQIRALTAGISAQTHDNYPAKRAILEIMAEGSKVDFDTACVIDSRYFAELVRTPECKNMISTFWFDQRAIEQGVNRPRGFGKFRPRKVGIIGAGQMGSGIALACLTSGMRVVLKDVSKPIAERGREWVARRLDELIEEGTFQQSERLDILSRIIATEHASDFAECDLVIEAVFENEMVKQKVTKEAEAYLDEYSLLATNSISIPITRLATVSIRPSNYVGLHFFAPADTVPLIEIVRGQATSDETVARAFDFVTAISKIPIVVTDHWGFYAARVQNTYILEGITLLNEGYPAALIENLGQQAGMPKGPLALADDLGLSFVLNYEHQAAAHYGSKYTQHPAVQVLEQMLDTLNRPGRSKRQGFYEYDEQCDRYLWPDLREHFPVTQADYDAQTITERLLFAQVLEAVWCMHEGVIMRRESANLGSVYGWGFPAFKGGVIRYIYDYGLADFMERCKIYRRAHGQRFQAPKLLKKWQATSYEDGWQSDAPPTHYSPVVVK